MTKPVKFLICAVLLTLLNTPSVAQEELQKNPFSQPDFLNYSPPVKNQVEKQNAPEIIPEFILSATFISVNGPMAIVNDNLLSIGEEIDGTRLLQVDEDSASIRYKGKTYDIQIVNTQSTQTQQIRRNVVK